MSRNLDRLTADPHPNDDERHEVGTEEGETCGRYEEPDEGAPRGYKPRPCNGVMGLQYEDGESNETWIECGTCGEIAFTAYNLAHIQEQAQ